MQEIDHAIKTLLTRNANSILDLAFGSQRTIKLKGLADSQINIPELRADKTLVVEDRGKISYLICEAMLQPKRNKLFSFALKTLGNQYLLKKPSFILIDIRAFGAKIVLSEFTKKELSMLKETSFVQEWLNETAKESLQKGWQEGRQEGKRSVVEIILKQKLGALPPRLRGQLQKLDDKKLDRLTVKLPQIMSQKDLQAWLKNGTSRHVSH